jgi:hypothetical protein
VVIGVDAMVASRLRSPLALPQASMVEEHTAEGIAGKLLGIFAIEHAI